MAVRLNSKLESPLKSPPAIIVQRLLAAPASTTADRVVHNNRLHIHYFSPSSLSLCPKFVGSSSLWVMVLVERCASLRLAYTSSCHPCTDTPKPHFTDLFADCFLERNVPGGAHPIPVPYLSHWDANMWTTRVLYFGANTV